MVEGLLISEPKRPVIVPTLYGFSLHVDPEKGKGVEEQVFRTGTYEEGTLFVMERSLNRGDTFLDIGANVGLMSIFASSVVGPKGVVHSFEPDPDLIALLQDNLRLNDVKNVETHNLALGSTPVTTSLYRHLDINRGAGSLLRIEDRCTGEVEVHVQTLDEFVANNILTDVRMIKIDVEGWELEVLKGGETLLSGPDAPILSVEFSESHPLKGGSLTDLFEYIKGLNEYKIFKLRRGKGVKSDLVEVEEEEEIPAHDNLFCFLPSHLKQIECLL